MQRHLSVALAVVCLAFCGCKPSHYESHGVSWKLPRGVALESEGPAPGTTATAQFSGGVQVRFYALDGMPTEADEGHLEDIAKKVLPPNMTPVSKRGGTLPAGKVARFVWQEAGNRTLLYYLPTKTQVVVVSLTAPENRFSAQEDHFDMSLGSLKVQ
jgi:hypothetical protein